MALSKEDKKRFLPDLLPDNTIVEVVKTGPDGYSQKKDMTFREWKEMKKQAGFSYVAFQKGFSQFKLEK